MFTDESVDWSVLNDVKEGYELCKPFMTQFGGHWQLQVESATDKLAFSQVSFSFGPESDSLRMLFCPNEDMFYLCKTKGKWSHKYYECLISDLNIDDAKQWIADTMAENKYG